ncbi:aminotransferase class I/II-fold pyridoxal phosphate-dependent enzyme [Yoonia sp. MH D7]
MKITPFDATAGLDAAIAQFGGTRAQWLDLSTGINPVPYPAPRLPADVWTALPDKAAFKRLSGYARSFWNVPDGAAILPASGSAAIIAALAQIFPNDDATLAVHPSFPDGQAWNVDQFTAPTTLIDEGFCDVAPAASFIARTAMPNTLIVKSFSRFWGLAGLRLGFAIGDPSLIRKLGDILGPYNVSGPALAIGCEALADPAWADDTRIRLGKDAQRLDAIMENQGAPVIGGTDLFRLYEVGDAKAAQTHLAQHKVWTRTFDHTPDWLMISLPAPDRWAHVEGAF